MSQKAASKALVKYEPKEVSKEELWVWTMPKRRALALYMRGAFLVDIATAVHVDRRTIQRWVKAPEFIDKVARLLNERDLSGSMKQSYFTSTVTRELQERYMKALKRFKRAQLSPKKSIKRLEMRHMLLAEMEKISKEFEKLRNQHRLDHGQATTVSKHTSMVLHGGKVDHQHNHQAGASFRDYMEAHKHAISINPGTSEQQQLIDATVQVMQGTDYLEKVAAKEAEFEEAEEAK